MWTRGVALVAGLILVGGSLGGCAALEPGPRTTEQMPIEDVGVVELAAGGSLNITLGTTPSLTVTAGEKVIDRLTADVESGVLRLGIRAESTGYVGEIRYELVISALSSITVLGSGDAAVDFTGTADPSIVVRGSGGVEAVGVDAQTVSLTVAGSGSIDVSGMKAQQLTARIDGSGGVRIDGTVADQDVELRGPGEYSASDLSTVDARVAVRGDGEASIAVSGALDAEVDGSGEIIYAGDPRVTEDVTGSGEVNRR